MCKGTNRLVHMTRRLHLCMSKEKGDNAERMSIVRVFRLDIS